MPNTGDHLRGENSCQFQAFKNGGPIQIPDLVLEENPFLLIWSFQRTDVEVATRAVEAEGSETEEAGMQAEEAETQGGTRPTDRATTTSIWMTRKSSQSPREVGYSWLYA